MKNTRKKRLFHLIGIVCVGFWFVMVGLLIRKVHFSAPPEGDQPEASRPIDSAEREWKEIFLKGRKVGYAVGMIKPFGEGYYIREEIFLWLNLAGSKGGLYSLTQAQVDEKFQMRNFYFLMTSGVVRFSISGKMEGDYLVLNTGRGEGERVQRIKMAHPPVLAAGLDYFLRSKKISVGESFRVPLLDPATLSQKEALIRVTGKENLTLHQISYEAYRIEAEVWGKPVTLWVDEKGVTLKEEGFMGFTLMRSNPSRAVVFTEGDEAMDLYELTAVKPDRSLRDPAKVKVLKVKLEGIDERPFFTLGLQGGRQKVEQKVLTVTKESIPLTPSYSVPFLPAEWAKPFLEPEFNLESDDPEIIKKAIAICGTEKDPVKAARRLLSWVYGHIEKRPVLSVPSALETLRTGVGDCNEHATLLTALLRAVGIPARLSMGLVYSREKFYYHAWTEAYLGDWVSMDATLNQMPVDATHVKFIEGNLEKQIEMVKVMEELELKVIAFEHD